MNPLDPHLLTRFIGRASISILGCAGLYLWIEVIDRWRWLERRPGGPEVLLEFLLGRLPLALSHVIPVAGLLAALGVGLELRRNRELHALVSLGYSPWRVMRGILLGGLLLGLGHAALCEWWLPVATERLEVRGLIPPSRRVRNVGSGHWWVAGQDLARASRSSSGERWLEHIELSADGTPRALLRARVRGWEGGRGLLGPGERWTLPTPTDPSRPSSWEKLERLELELDVPPTELDLRLELAIGRPWRALAEEARSGKGLQARAARVALHLRGTLPLSCVLLVLVGLPEVLAAGRSSERSRVLGGLARGGGVYGLVALGAWAGLTTGAAALVWLPLAGGSALTWLEWRRAGG